MNLDMTWGELARAAGGRLTAGNPEDKVESLGTDSRRLEEGQIFWALKGPNFDGHSFLSAELALKSSGWVIEKSRKNAALHPKHLVETANSLKALQALAAAHRRRFDIPIVGITGSNGKTTTKEMLRSICARVGLTCANSGNLNNQLGVPLSLLELTPAHRYGLFEMGASRPGEIEELGLIAQPTVGVLTNIGPAHLEFFGTLEQTFKTKSELIDVMAPDTKIALNIDDPWLTCLEQSLGSRAVTYGKSPRARVRIEGPNTLIVDRHSIEVPLAAFGDLSRYNAAAAAAAAHALGLDADTIAKGLKDYQPAKLRLEKRLHPSGCHMVIDAYNANPASMRAGIEAFCEHYAADKKILVLGDMKELGPESGRFHGELGTWLAGLPLEAVYLAGPEMKSAYEALTAARPAFKFFHGAPEEWLSALSADAGSGKAVFFKASRAMKFELIADLMAGGRKP